MSELVNTQNRNPQLRWRLLATVSAIALAAHIVPATAQDASRPTVWIELGAQYENVTGQNDPFVPHYDADARDLGFPSITEIENALGKSFGGEGSLSFQPHASDWIFMASARYGRTHTARAAHAEKALIGPPVAQYLTPGGKHLKTGGGNAYLVTPSAMAYVDQSADNTESHAIVDFQVGKDVGLGLFGRGTESTFGFGARYAQMSASSQLNSHTLPDTEFAVKQGVFPGKYVIQQTHHNSASFAERYSDFRALGPSLSLSNATSLIGNVDDGRLSLDWGANIAVLFGRQRTHVSHQTTTRKHGGGGSYAGADVIVSQVTGGDNRTTSRHIIIPNVGGFAAVSYRFTNAKISAGYRADFFFGALDRGLDTRDAATLGFHGPFATVAFGFGG